MMEIPPRPVLINVAKHNRQGEKQKNNSNTEEEASYTSKAAFIEKLNEQIKRLMKHPLARIVRFLLFILAYVKIATVIWNAASQLLDAIRRSAKIMQA